MRRCGCLIWGKLGMFKKRKGDSHLLEDFVQEILVRYSGVW